MEDKQDNKAKQAPSSEQKADNASVYDQPTVEQKTKQGEAQIDTSQAKGHDYKNTLPEKESGEETTTGFNKT